MLRRPKPLSLESESGEHKLHRTIVVLNKAPGTNSGIGWRRPVPLDTGFENKTTPIINTVPIKTTPVISTVPKKLDSTSNRSSLKQSIATESPPIKVTGTDKQYSSGSFSSIPSTSIRGSARRPPSERAAIPHFIYVQPIGRGQNGVVMMAVTTKDFKVLAIKRMNISKANKRKQITEELKTLSRHHHKNIVRLMSLNENQNEHAILFSQGKVAFCLEYMNGGSLGHWIDRHGALNENVTASVVRQALQGLGKLHDSNYIHGDIKPENILVNMAGEAKITDFGLAREVVSPRGIFSTGGTMLYLSPERIFRKRFMYPSDVWAIGITSIVLLTGGSDEHSCYKAKEYWGLVDEIKTCAPPVLPPEKFSKEFQSVVKICLQKDPNERKSVRELLQLPIFSETKLYPIDSWYTNDRLDCKQEESRRILKAERMIRDLCTKILDIDRARCEEGYPLLSNDVTLSVLQSIAEQLGAPSGKMLSEIKEIKNEHDAQIQRLIDAISGSESDRYSEVGEEKHSGGRHIWSRNPHQTPAAARSMLFSNINLPSLPVPYHEKKNRPGIPEWAQVITQPKGGDKGLRRRWSSWPHMMRIVRRVHPVNELPATSW